MLLFNNITICQFGNSCNMSNVQRVDKKTTVSVIIIGVLAVVANSWHVLSAWMNQPPGTYFTGIAHYFADYFLYTSIMAQKGWIFADQLFTNEPLPPTWIYWLYTIIGKLGNPFVVYNVSIVVFSAVVLFLWWYIIKQTTPSPFTRIVAFLFITTASGFSGRDFWFSPTPALNRLGGVPHQLFQTMLILSLFILFHKRKYFLLSVVSFVAALTNPIQMLLLSMALILTTPRVLPYLFPAVFGAFLTNFEFSKNPILLAAKQWELAQEARISLTNFALAVGPVIAVLPFGVTFFLSQKKPITMALFWFGLLSLVLFFSPVPALLGTSPVRWLSPASYGIVPILAAVGLTRVIKFVKKSQIASAAVILALYTMLTIPSLTTQITARMHAPAKLLYIPKNIVEKLRNISKDGVIITNPATPYDVIVPVFTGKKSFTGHPVHTLYSDVKQQLRVSFFNKSMTEEEQSQFLTNHHITAIFP